MRDLHGSFCVEPLIARSAVDLRTNKGISFVSQISVQEVKTYPVRDNSSRVDRYTPSLNGSLPRLTHTNPTLLQTIRSSLPLPTRTLPSIALGIRLGLGTEISSIDVRLDPVPGTETRHDELLVGLEDGAELFDTDIVEEGAGAEASIGNCESLFTVSCLPVGEYTLSLIKATSDVPWGQGG